MHLIRYCTSLLVICIALVMSSTGMAAQEMPLRYPLLELFTNTPCSICGATNPAMFERLEAYEGQYHHVSFYPGTPYPSCIFYRANIPENQARKSFYPQVFGSPTMAINGVDFRSSSGVTYSVLDDITGGTSWLSVEVIETAGSSRDVTIMLEDHVGGSVDEATLFAVIVEREIMYDAPNGETLHYNVFRKFLTEVDGEAVDLTPGLVSRSYNYDVDPEWQAGEIYVVAWLQDSNTKEVYNSGTRFDMATTSTMHPTTSRLLLIYPNPAKDYLNVDIPEGTGGVLLVYDTSGRQICRQSISQSSTSLPVAGWPAGSYHIELVSDQGVTRGRFDLVR